MVQVAAVKNDEDATVLTNALRRRGYPVISHRDPADGLIHVRIGPFQGVSDRGGGDCSGEPCQRLQ